LYMRYADYRVEGGSHPFDKFTTRGSIRVYRFLLPLKYIYYGAKVSILAFLSRFRGVQ
jgi:hypothetical protein